MIMVEIVIVDKPERKQGKQYIMNETDILEKKLVVSKIKYVLLISLEALLLINRNSFATKLRSRCELR